MHSWIRRPNISSRIHLVAQSGCASHRTDALEGLEGTLWWQKYGLEADRHTSRVQCCTRMVLVLAGRPQV
jgi:hypothetical protein